jgi:hypothetical protein
MKSNKLVLIAALLSGVGLGAVLVGAQTGDTAATALVSDPLGNYTLDVLIPARSAEDTASYVGVAKKWIEQSAGYEKNAKKARELVKTRVSVKETEIRALEAKVKEAKTAGDKAEIERIKGDIKLQKDQLAALKAIQAYSGEWDDLANAMENTGKAWLAFLEAEQEVVNRRSQAAKRAKGPKDAETAGMPTQEDFKAHKKYADAVNKFGNALENHGKALQQLSGNASKVMSDWEKRSFTE